MVVKTYMLQDGQQAHRYTRPQAPASREASFEDLLTSSPMNTTSRANVRIEE